jgi:short-subunit dehydrogenase
MIDILVNNAGMLIFSEVTDVPEQKVQTILNLHMHTPVMLCRLLGEDMRKRGSGYILNVSSISAVMPYPGISLYGPTKTLIRQFSRAFRYEMETYGVQVCTVLPGATETALYDPDRVNLKLAKRLGIMQTADHVARRSLAALFQGKAEYIPGWLNKLTVYILPLVPRFVILIIYRNSDWISKGKQALG